MSETTERALLAGGCFWGMQDLIRKLPGVQKTRVGYTGGDVPNATYRNHGTHAEGIEIIFDPAKTSYRKLLEFFFQIHDPTTKNRQGNDVGTQYASVIFYDGEEQKKAGEEVIAALKSDGLDVKTRLDPAPEFFEAEDYHQDFYARNPSQGYCNAVIPPKLAKLQSKFVDYLK